LNLVRKVHFFCSAFLKALLRIDVFEGITEKLIAGICCTGSNR